MVPAAIQALNANAHIVMPGVIALNAGLTNVQSIQENLRGQGAALLEEAGVFMLVLTEDAAWMAAQMNNFFLKLRW